MCKTVTFPELRTFIGSTGIQNNFEEVLYEYAAWNFDTACGHWNITRYSVTEPNTHDSEVVISTDPYTGKRLFCKLDTSDDSKK